MIVVVDAEHVVVFGSFSIAVQCSSGLGQAALLRFRHLLASLRGRRCAGALGARRRRARDGPRRHVVVGARRRRP